ncbi:FAD-binding oxidoreductase [Brachymonas sp. M4Q-1]|uniref:FAD-binding oxidoreductase n=1 Tax=Brachymonas sp. M4Q-1 TaxID=3416906 RepID=UPI003CF88E35
MQDSALSTAGLASRLATLVGADHVLTGTDAAPYCNDWRKRYHGQALCVVRPGSTAEVAAVVRACADSGTPIVPQGGNTSLVGGATPDADGRSVVLSLGRMHAIRRIDAANLTLTAESGCVLQQVQEAAAAAGHLFPLSMASEGSCTLGGNLGTNAGGTQVLRYGNTRELCLGLEVVTPQGDIWDGLQGLRKDNTGYDLRDLYIGSEGTLGIITAATMKLFPMPRVQLTAWAAVPSVQAAVDLLGLARQHLHAGLTGFEMMSRFALTLVDRHFPQLHVPLYHDTPYCVLLENSDFDGEESARARFEALLEAALASGCVTDAIVAESLSQAQALWHMRESISLAQSEEGLNIKHDISLPVSAIPAFVAETDAALGQAVPGVRIVNFGHLGDGNLHYNIQAPEGQDPAIFLREQEPGINTLVFDAVARHGGSISAEHGIGLLKRDTLPHYKSPVALALMRSLKQALDPRNLMNPGRVLGH